MNKPIISSQEKTVLVNDSSGTEPKLSSIDLGSPSRNVAISPDGLRAYVSHSEKISVIDTKKNCLIDTIATPESSISYAMAISQDGAKVYVAAHRENQILVINTHTGSIIKRLSAEHVTSIGMSPDGSRCYALTNNTGDYAPVSIIDTGSDEIIKTFEVWGNSGYLKVSSDGRRFYYLHSSGFLVASDAATGKVIKDLDFQGNPGGLDLSPDGAKAYVVDANSNRINVIDTGSFQLINTISAPTTHLSSIKVNPDGTRAYFCSHRLDHRNVHVLDTKAGQVIDTFAAGNKPRGLAFTPNGAYVYICDIEGNAVSVVATV